VHQQRFGWTRPCRTRRPTTSAPRPQGRPRAAGARTRLARSRCGTARIPRRPRRSAVPPWGM
jgi:hypothetical protein